MLVITSIKGRPKRVPCRGRDHYAVTTMRAWQSDNTWRADPICGRGDGYIRAREVCCCRNGSVPVCPQPHCCLPVFPSSSCPLPLSIHSRHSLHCSTAVLLCSRCKAKGCPLQNSRRHSSKQSPCCRQAYSSQALLHKSAQALRSQWTLHLYCLRRLISSLTTNKLSYSMPSPMPSLCTQTSSLQLSSNAAIVKHEQDTTINLSTTHFYCMIFGFKYLLDSIFYLICTDHKITSSSIPFSGVCVCVLVRT